MCCEIKAHDVYSRNSTGKCKDKDACGKTQCLSQMCNSVREWPCVKFYLRLGDLPAFMT